MNIIKNLPATIIESRLILLVALVQFVNILDFMMVMPLGPDFARHLGISAGDIGIIGGSYTFAAAISGLLSALFLDKFSRRKGIIFCLSGLAIATIAGAAVWNKESMIFVRLTAGIFGGPLSSLSMALIADYIPAERRGRAMGKISGAFAASSVLGVPFGLELASRISWHAPFIATGLLAFGALWFVCLTLPSSKAFDEGKNIKDKVLHLTKILKSETTMMSYAFMAFAMLSSFMIIPNISAHLQINMHFPREQLGILYFVGGSLSFFGMRASGWLVV